MNNIKTKKDILGWAKEIVDGKGDKYIPLGKADMFAIAKYIAHGECNLTEDLELKDIPPPTTGDAKPSETDEEAPKLPPPSHTATADSPANPKPVVEETKTSGDFAHTDTSGKQTTTATMMRSYALHRAGFTAQQAYDKFLKWRNENPKEASVMDFSTGTKRSTAAFAYWLAEIISVEVPNTSSARI